MCWVLPFIGLSRLLTVGFHEMSHAFAGVLTCAKIHSIELDRKWLSLHICLY